MVAQLIQVPLGKKISYIHRTWSWKASGISSSFFQLTAFLLFKKHSSYLCLFSTPMLSGCRLLQGRQNLSCSSLKPQHLVMARFVQVSTQWMSKQLKNPRRKCWWECGKTGTLVHCWWGYKRVHPLWKTVWQFPPKLKIKCTTSSSKSISGDIYIYKTSNLESKDTKRCLYTHAHSGIIHPRQ